MKCRRAFTKFGDISENLQWFSRQQQRQGEDRQKTRIFSVLDQPNSKGKYFENIIDRIYCLQTKSLLVKGEDTRKKKLFFFFSSPHRSIVLLLPSPFFINVQASAEERIYRTLFKIIRYVELCVRAKDV